MPWRELAFLSWAGLRGAVPIVLTTIPLADGRGRGRSGSSTSSSSWSCIYTLVTGPTLPLVARVLRVARRSEPRGLEVEAAPLERIAADLLQVTISPVSRMHGVEVGELRLPQGASVAMVDPRRRDAGARAAYGAAPRRRPAGRDPAQAARADRAAAASGQRGRPPGPVAGRGATPTPDRPVGQVTGGLQISLSCGGLTDLPALASSVNQSPTITTTPAPVVVAPHDLRRPARGGCATSSTAGLRRARSVQISTWPTSARSRVRCRCRPRRSRRRRRARMVGRPGRRGCRR